MGNKHSSTAGHRTSDPTARSFSWQPEHLNAQPTQLPAPPHRQFMGGTFIDENCNRVPGRNSRDPLRRRSCINGSVVEDEAVFGGVFPAQDQASPLQMSSQFWPPLDGTTSPNESPSKKSKPGTTDSGYFTAFDSDGKSRSSKLRGSRLSLNEAVFNHQDFETSPPLNNMPAMGHFPPPPPPGHFEPRHFPMPPPSNGPFIRGPDPFLMPPPFPPADLDSKKAKKWHKKQLKKLQKSNPSDLHLMPLGPMKPNGPQPLIVPPFGNQGLAPFRAQSMGNLAAKGLYLTNQMPEFQIPPPGIPPPPNPLDRRANSHLDLNAAPPWMYLQPPPGQFQVPQKPEIQEIKTDAIGRASKSPHGTGRSLLVSAEKASLSSGTGKGSRRSRGGSIAPEPTFFEEERQTTREESSRNSQMLFKRNISPPPSRNSDRDQAIYETLKAKKVLATAEISVVDSPKEQIAEADVTEQRKANFEVNFKEPQLPTKISPEAQAIMERNAKLLGFQQSENFQQSTGKLQAIFTENQETQDVKPPAPAQTQKQSLGIDAALEHLEIVKKSPSAVDEKEIAAIWNPILPRRKHKRPAEFLPLDAWESIDVSAELSARKINKSVDKSAAVVSEIIRVHLIPCPPTRSEIQGEPIYFEYDEKLPDFKKRLIETGSFDFPEKFQHSHPAESRKEEPSGHKETVVGLHGQNSPPAKDNFQNEDKEKSGSLKRLKNSVSNMFHRSKSAERPQSPPENAKIKTGQNPNCHQDILYTSTGSLTPSTANIKAGDSSDIDFSWVHDLETKFRREKEHYDPEFEEVNHKSFRRAQNRSSGDVVPSTTIQPSETGVAKRNFGDFSLQEAVGHSTPAQSRAAASHQRIVVSNDENVDIFGTDCSDHNPVPTRYFGVYETPKDHRVTHLDTESQLRQEELKQFSSNVRTKAAIFEKTNLNNLQISKPQKEIGDRGYFSRNHCPPFIPLPDYDTDYSSTLSVDTKQTNGLLPQVENKNAPAQLSVDTNVNCRSPYRVNAVFRSPRSPSQRKIHRLELQRQQEEGWVSTGIGEIHQGRPAFEPGLRYVHDSRLTAYRPDEMQGVNMVNGDSRLQFRNCGIIQDVFIDDGQVRVQYPMHKQNGYGSDLNLNGYSNGATSMNVYKSQPILNENENRYYVQ